jgi:glycerol-3-phosphate acyltransferase PlsY
VSARRRYSQYQLRHESQRLLQMKQCTYTRRMLELGFKTLLAYLLGSLIGSLIVGQLRGGVDIRNMGSGNAGGTNALRTQGLAFAVWVILIDAGKGWLAVALLPSLDLPGIGIDPQIDRSWLAVACAAAVVVGHVYPVWYGFRGGKGAATLVGVLIGLKAIALLPVFAVWLGAVMLTGFVGLATMLAVASFPAYVAVTHTEPQLALLTFGCGMTIFVCYTHRSNIERMRTGTENRARRLWLLRPR